MIHSIGATMHLRSLVAHRGIPALFPGNSLEGLQAVLEIGVQHLEFDIQISHDGIPVLFHDANLRRETGVDARVEDLTWTQLKEITFRKNKFDNPIYLTALTDAVNLVQQYPKTLIFAEIKRAAIQRSGILQSSNIILEILSPIRKRCIPISTHRGFLRHVRQTWECPIGWIVETWGEFNQRQANILKPEYLFANHANLSSDDCRHPASWTWVIYEISDPKLATEWLDRGATLIESNDCAQMISKTDKSE
jgi:glycerophosphoryl diester phosphodiesterase